MTLNRERLAISGTEDLMLIVCHPDAGSADADKPALLASVVLPTTGAQGDEQRHLRPASPPHRSGPS